MFVTMIAVIKSGKSIVGFRLVDYDQQTNTSKLYNLKYQNVFDALKKSPSAVSNLKIDNGKIASSNGTLDRYAIVNVKGDILKEVATIIKEVRGQNNELLGYVCASANGTVTPFASNTLLEQVTSNKLSISNGKVVTRDNKTIISSINGSYSTMQFVVKPAAKSKKEVDIEDQVEAVKPPDVSKKIAERQAKAAVKKEEKSSEEKAVDSAGSVGSAIEEKPADTPVAVTKQDEQSEEQSEVVNAASDSNSEAEEISVDSTPETTTEAEPEVENTTATTTTTAATTQQQSSTPSTSTPVDEDTARYNEAMQLIEKLKATPNYSGSFASKVADTIVLKKKCSEKQLSVLKEAESGDNHNIEEAKKVIDELKTYACFTSAEKVYKIAESVTSNNRCTDKQLYALNKALETYKSENRRKKAIVNATPIVEEKPKPASVQEPVKQETKPEEKKPDLPKYELPEQSGSGEAETEEVTFVDSWASKVATKQTERKVPEIVAADNAADMFEYVKYDNGDIYVNKLKPDYVDKAINLVIPDTVEINGKQVEVRGIGNGAFSNTRIVALKTGKNIRDIGPGICKHCEHLEVVDLKASSHTFIAKYAFYGCKSLTDVAIGNGDFKKIHEYAFKDCKMLTSITGPAELGEIAAHAFDGCIRLASFSIPVGKVMQSAFKNCWSLHDFNFSKCAYIESSAFYCCGFSILDIPSNVKELRERSFAMNPLLNKVTLQEGVTTVGDNCFYKSEKDILSNNETYGVKGFYSNLGIDPWYVELEYIEAPRSLTQVIGNGFNSAKSVGCYVQSVAEGACITYNIIRVNRDNVSADNASITRVKSLIFGGGNNPNLIIYEAMQEGLEGASNPEYEMDTAGNLNVPFNDELSTLFNIPLSTEVIEPHIKFKAMVNYLKDITDHKAFTLPISTKLLKLKSIFVVCNRKVFDDGCNKIYEVQYVIRDSLESGNFMVVISNNVIIYMTDCVTATALKCTSALNTDDYIPIEHLYQGDRIGILGAMNGYATELVENINRHGYSYQRKVSIGEKIATKFYDNAFRIGLKNNSILLFIPCADKTENSYQVSRILSLKRNGDAACNPKKENEKSKLRIRGYADETDVDDINGYVFNIDSTDVTRAEMISKLTSEDAFKSSNFFDQFDTMTDAEIEKRIADLQVIGEEKEAQLFDVSRQLNASIAKTGNSDIASNLTPEIFEAIANSYWLTEIDNTRFKTSKGKSLNQTNQIIFNGYTLTEYASNQVVKFNNGYMHGGKDCSVFSLAKGDKIIGYYASRYSLNRIFDMVVNVTNIPNLAPSETPPELMTDPSKLDVLDSKWFFEFYQVLKNTNDWDISNYIGFRYPGSNYVTPFNKSSYGYSYNYNSNAALVSLLNSSVQFWIAMYKPTGIYYFVFTRYNVSNGKNGKVTISNKKVIPLFPIGNIDRALLVAETTNQKVTQSTFLKELLLVVAQEVIDTTKSIGAAPKDREIVLIDNNKIVTAPSYYKVRELLMAGDTNIDHYSPYIDDRGLFMLGAVHSGTLQRDFTGCSEAYRNKCLGVKPAKTITKPNRKK